MASTRSTRSRSLGRVLLETQQQISNPPSSASGPADAVIDSVASSASQPSSNVSFGHLSSPNNQVGVPSSTGSIISGPPPGLFHGPSSSGPKKLIAPFTGKDSKVHVDAWMNIYDIVMFEKSEREKCYLLIQHIDGPAMTWFSRHVIPILDSSSWSQVRSKFISRFKHQDVRPVVAASERNLGYNESVETYYTEKMVLMQETNLLDSDMVAFLNKGMPQMYRGYLIASKISTPSEWFSTALELEAMFKIKRPIIDNAGSAKPGMWRNQGPSRPMAAAAKPSGPAPGPDRFKKKPPSPCKHCLKAGETKYHWNSDCHRLSQAKPTAAEVNETSNAASVSAVSLNSGSGQSTAH